MIYTYYVVTARVNGRTTRTTTCGHCGASFEYVAEMKAEGKASYHFNIFKARATRKAQEQAERRLQKALATAPFAVPCPCCARYQDDMLWAVRSSQYRRMRWLVVGLYAAAPLLFFPPALLLSHYFVKDVIGLSVARTQGVFELVMVLSFVIAAVPGFAAHLWRRARQRAFDPNRDIPEEERFAIARNWAWVAPPDESPT